MVEIQRGDVKSILTPASGFMKQYKYTLNPYSGCGFGCEYCYARFFAPTETKRESWGNWVTVKENAATLLRSACTKGILRTGDAVYMSSVTDPYQPIEQRLRLTRAILETLLECDVQPRLTIQTRSPIATRDIDLFKRFEKLRVNFTINADSEDVRLRYEPHCPSIEVRLRAADQLAARGVRIGVSISPMLPLRDIHTFAERIANLQADEYVTQYLKPGRSMFAGETSSSIRSKLREDAWSIREYQVARDELASALGERHPLLEGAEGYAPA